MTHRSDELPYWLALLYAPQIGSVGFHKLYNKFTKLSDLFNASAEELIQSGCTKDLIQYLSKPNWSQVEKDLLSIEQNQIQVILLDDEVYPEILRQIAVPPPVLFAQGNLGCINSKQIAMVGSRNPSAHGCSIARHFAVKLTELGFVITSGLALGIDAASHEGCLDAKGCTIAVLGTGLNHVYPRRHLRLAEKIKENGVLLSEFPPDVAPLACNFPRRNRIISGLSLGVFVVEATLRSGSLITARYGLEQGKEIFALPGSIYNPLSRGCHQLLKNGAKLVESVEDIVEEISPNLFTDLNVRAPKQAMVLAFDQHKLLQCLDFSATPVDLLVKRCPMPVSNILKLLAELELLGIVAAVPGGYVRNI
ncbi:MAG: DNA-processing protein DprA [Gammaproteobacteria bacterium]